MENQANSKSIILNYGLYLGIIGVFLQLIKYAMGNHLENDMITGSISIIASIVLITLGIKKFKTTNNNLLSFGQSLKVGLGITIISLLISVVYMIIFTSFIEPTFKEQALEKTIESWRDQGMNEDMIEQYTKAAKDYFYLSLYGMIVLISIFFGFVVSAVAGAIMKKSPEEQY